MRIEVGKYTVYKSSNRSEYFLLCGDKSNKKYYVYNHGDVIEITDIQRDTIILDYSLLPIGTCRSTDFSMGVCYDR